MLGIPGELVDATEHLLAMADDWRPRKVDLGVVNGRCFTFASGLGVDASVVERVDSNPRLKARLGAYYFTWAAISTFARRYLVHPPRMVAQAGGQRSRASPRSCRTARPSPTSTTARSSSPRARRSTRGARGLVLHRARPLDMPSIAWRAFSRRARSRATAIAQPPRLARVDGAERRRASLPLQVDGDYIGEVAEARYSILPRALNVVC